MIKLQQRFKVIALPAIFLLCSFVVVPLSYVSKNDDGNMNSISTVQQPTPHTTLASQSKKSTKKADSNSKAVIKPRDKSVLDAEVLASPITYLKKALSSDDEEQSDSDVESGDTIVIAVKALVATLLSTIL